MDQCPDDFRPDQRIGLVLIWLTRSWEILAFWSAGVAAAFWGAFASEAIRSAGGNAVQVVGLVAEGDPGGHFRVGAARHAAAKRQQNSTPSGFWPTPYMLAIAFQGGGLGDRPRDKEPGL